MSTILAERPAWNPRTVFSVQTTLPVWQGPTLTARRRAPASIFSRQNRAQSHTFAQWHTWPAKQSSPVGHADHLGIDESPVLKANLAAGLTGTTGDPPGMSFATASDAHRGGVLRFRARIA